MIVKGWEVPDLPEGEIKMQYQNTSYFFKKYRLSQNLKIWFLKSLFSVLPYVIDIGTVSI